MTNVRRPPAEDGAAVADAAPREQVGARICAFTRAPALGVRVAFRGGYYHVVGWLQDNPTVDARAAESASAPEVRGRSRSKPTRLLWASQHAAGHVLLERLSDSSRRPAPLCEVQVCTIGTLTAQTLERLTVRSAQLVGQAFRGRPS